ncbi:MAG: isoprenylcysteine carboxylmethyltransferase family protein [Deltaproteobacteria bacterium]|nr:isoprenylcysteine carboxylmethyltransferase family protein [Deltaproteobacteria bacterium]
MSLKKRFSAPRFLIGYLLIPIAFILAHPTNLSLNIGCLFLILGESLRLWANSYIGHRKVTRQRTGFQTGTLITAGPYAYVRHPLYTGSLLITLGFTIIIGYPWLIPISISTMLYLYHKKSANEEKESLIASYPSEYTVYQKTIPKFFPLFQRYPMRHGTPSFQGLSESKEWITMSWLTTAVLFFYFKMELMTKQKILFFSNPWEHSLLLALLLSVLAYNIWQGLKRYRRLA